MTAALELSFSNSKWELDKNSYMNRLGQFYVWLIWSDSEMSTEVRLPFQYANISLFEMESSLFLLLVLFFIIVTEANHAGIYHLT